MALILINTLHRMVEHGEFSLKFVAESGEIIHAKRCICTSFHSKGRTMNIKFIPSGEVRTVRRCTIIAFNDTEVAL